MSETWRRCSHYGDAIVDHDDEETGEQLAIRVPWEHRTTAIGWGRRRRAKWTHPLRGEMQALIVSEGKHGVLARDEQGGMHALPHDTYEPIEWPEAKPLEKAVRGPEPMHKAKAIPPGARWITVRPNGPGTEGHPLLVMPAGDGTHRVIGGADGKLNHLRLHGVGSAEKHKEQAKERQKFKRAAERERRKKLTPEERAAEDTEKEAAEARQHQAERKVVEVVRKRWGGITDDLTDDDTAGLSEAAAETLKKRHHRKQFAEAQRARRDIAEKLAKERVEQIEDEAAVAETIREEPDLWETAQALGEKELALIEDEKASRRRAGSAHRADPDARRDLRAATTSKALDQVDRAQTARDLEELGGRPKADTLLPMIGETASEESRRRAVEAVDNALILHDAANGVDPSDDPVRAQLEFQVIADALKQAGVDPSDHEAARAVLANEAAIAFQQAQLHRVKAEKFEQLERAGKAEQALKALVHTDVVRGLNREVRDATRRLGLRADAKTPLRESEIAEMLDVLGSFDELRKASKTLDDVVKEAEPPKYDASRRAFKLSNDEPPDHVVENVEELVKRELATRIVGLADTKSTAHAKAVADGHYAKLADISLAVSNANHVDRSVVDALGLKNASHLLRYALEQEGHDADTLHNAVVGHHVRTQTQITADALRLADSFVPNIEQTVEDAGDIEHALKRIDASEADLDDAQRAIGSALGQMESTATLGQVLRGKPPEHLAIELKDKGTSGLAGHLTWLASIGLKPEQYEIDPENKEIRIPREHWGSLLNKEDAGAIQKRKDAHAIKRGEEDEEGWMPRGMVSRTSSSFTDPPKTAPRYHTGLDLGAEDIHTALSDHIGSRLADGERPHDVLTDLLSPAVAGKAADAESFTDVVRSFFPTQTDEDKADHAENQRIRSERERLTASYRAAQDDSDVHTLDAIVDQIAKLPQEKAIQPKRDTHFSEHYEKLAADYLKRKHPGASTVHGASLHQDGVDDAQVRESVFRALASNPEHVAAFTPIGELTPAHREALKQHFLKRAGISETGDYSKEFGEQLAQRVADIQSGKIDSTPVTPGGGSLFGAPAPVKHLSVDTLHELHPAEAKKLAIEYPREGKELHAKAMGPRPAEPTTPSRLKPEHAAAVEAVRAQHPAMPSHELAKEASTHIGREKAIKELGATPDQLAERDPVTGQLTAKARALGTKVEARAVQLAERGIDPREIQKQYGHLIHDGEREAFERHLKRNATPWASFVDLHGGRAQAYTALQEEMKGEFAGNLRDHYAKVTGKALQTGIAEVPNADLHAQALASPAGRKDLAEARRKEVDAARGRGAAGSRDEAGNALGGKFSHGSALEKYRQAQDAERSIAQRQGGLFGGGPPPVGKIVNATPGEKRAPKNGERLSLGHRVENEVQSIVGGNVGKTLDLDKKVRLFPGASMDGRRIHQQRVIKMLRKGKRVGAWLGTGSGKTPTSIGAFTDLHATGDASHGLFLVPTAVQSQFGEEMLSFTEPGKYRFETGDGKGHEDRVAMLRDKGVHMRVLTHQSAAKTFLKIAADHHGIAPEAMLEKLRGQDDHQRAATLREALDGAGIPKHLTYVDEAHGLTTRQGEQESDTSIVIGALSHPTNSTHALFGSATPHKNDTSEVYSMARLLDPHRYHDAYKFTQKYGVGSVAAPDAIRRELDGHTYTASIPPDGVSRFDTANPTIGSDGKKTPGGPLPLDPEHTKAVDAVTSAYEKATAAARTGGVDVESTRLLSPERFKQAKPEQHEAIARELAPALGIVKETAIRKALQLAPAAHNAKLRAMTDVIDHDLKHGRQSVVFTDSAEEAHHVHQHLVSRGIAAGMYDGSLTGDARDQFRQDYDAGKHKVGVMTAAGEAGINMQSAKTIHHYDVPKTAKSWSQRNGRAYRQGQKDNVDVHDWTFDHDHDASGSRRLQDKGRLADVHQTALGPLDEHGIARDYHAALTAKHDAFDVMGHGK